MQTSSGQSAASLDGQEVTRIYSDMVTKREDNPAAKALVGTPFSMSRRDSDTAYESERQEWKESADTLRQAVGTSPYDSDEDNAMFDSMCTQAADTYE